MRYLRHIARSPKLVAQLLLLMGLAGLIGGTGLAGLFAARNAVTEITTRQVPAVAHLLYAERDIARANYMALGAVIDPNPHHRDQVGLPSLRSLSAAASDEFQQFQTAQGQAAAQAPLVAEIRGLLARWRGVIARAQLLGKSGGAIPPTIIVAAFAGDNAAIVRPLSQDLGRLVLLNTEEARQAKNGAVSAMTTATLVLSGVIVFTLFLAICFQVGISAREHRRKALIQQSADLVVLVDARGTILSASPSHERLLGYVPTELVGREGFELLHPDDQSLMAEALARRVSDVEGSHEHEIRFLHADGTYRWLAISAVNKLHDPLVGGIIITSRDITARKDTEAALAFQATHDALTTLPNRFHLQESIERALKEAVSTGGTPIALLLLDLDRFKEVNDTLGHAAGDMLLAEVGLRLARVVRTHDVVARLGGDEFAVLLPAANESTARRLADRLLQALEAPVHIAEQAILIEASIGVALFPAHGQDPQGLLQHADVAMYEAKRKHQRTVVYAPIQDQYSVHRLALTQELRQAVDDNLLLLYYQPKVAPLTDRLEGTEVLLRWRHPVQGFIPPDQFIPLAEQSGLIEPLTTWVLKTALGQCRTWREAGRTIAVAVNLSARTLQNPQFPDAIARLLDEYGHAPELLTLEITESSVMSDPVRALDVLSRLHALGVRLSIDDFGTGYSSLGYLKELPVDEVKIDKSFVLGMGTAADAKNAAIVRSIIALAHALGLRVVAEGVEDVQTRATLSVLHCDIIQGYQVSRPLAAGDFVNWLESNRVKAEPPSSITPRTLVRLQA